GSYPAAGLLMARLQLEGDAPGDYPYHPPAAAPQPAQPPQPAANTAAKPKLGSKTLARARKLIHHNKAQQAGNPAETAATPNAPAPPAFTPPELPPVYTRELADGVKNYQHRHGLTEDGKLTADTVRNLNVPLTERVIQL